VDPYRAASTMAEAAAPVTRVNCTAACINRVKKLL